MSWPGLGISPGTLQRAVRVANAPPGGPASVRDALVAAPLVAAPVAHADEISLRVNGNLHRLPVLSTNRLTAYFPQPKRGAEALDGFGLLTLFAGVLVHDHWSAYERYQSLHAFCYAHHLRERSASAERSPSQPWATDMITLMITLLCQTNAVVGEDQDLETLPTRNVEHLRTRYDTILSKAAAGNPPRPRRPGTRGRVKQAPAYNLIRRLREHRNEVLPALPHRPARPFDNNQAERDLRMPKLKQKIFGCCRSDTGAEDFAILRSYLSTHRKQSDDTFNSLVLTFQGSPPMPPLE